MGPAVAALHNEKALAHPRSGGLLDPGFEDRSDVDPDAAEEEGPGRFIAAIAGIGDNGDLLEHGRAPAGTDLPGSRRSDKKGSKGRCPSDDHSLCRARYSITTTTA